MSDTPTIADVAAKLDAVLARDEHWPRFLSVDRAADYCSLSPVSIRRLISAGKLAALRPVRGRIVIDRMALDSFVLGNNQKPRRGRGIRNGKPPRNGGPSDA